MKTVRVEIEDEDYETISEHCERYGMAMTPWLSQFVEEAIEELVARIKEEEGEVGGS